MDPFVVGFIVGGVAGGMFVAGVIYLIGCAKF